MHSLSCVIITFNENKNIARCIRSVLPVVDEVVVVDANSTDETVAIARSLGATIYLRAFDDFSSQKGYAVTMANHKWILALDADEELSPLLAEQIHQIRQKPDFNAYEINILTNYCGKWIKHCGWYPKYKLRLFNRDHCGINGSPVHEGFVMKSDREKIGRLKGDLLHYSYDSVFHHMKKINLYTDLAVRHAERSGKRVPFLKLVFGPCWSFFQHYFLRLGFLDGYYGYILCKNMAFECSVKYAKIWMNQKSKSKTTITSA